MTDNETICAPATIPGTGAITVIRISGPAAFEIVDTVAVCRNGTISTTKGYTMKFCTISLPDGTLVDEVIAAVYRAPHSYTGEDSVELFCHASKYICNTVIELLLSSGARLAQPGEFSLRSFLAGKMDLTQAEAVADLISSTDAASHDLAMKQLKGGISSELVTMREELLRIVSLMELELDFSEEEVEFADRAQLRELLDKVIGHISQLVNSFRLGNAIKSGVPVAIVGATNTGKSTLLNALLGEDRAIVSDIAGTTRDTIEETLVIEGTTYRFIDTAGIRQTAETIEQIGIERSLSKLNSASIVIGMLDLTRNIDEILENARMICSKITPSQSLILVLNKVDSSLCNTFVTTSNILVKDNTRIKVPPFDCCLSSTEIPLISLSAKTGKGLPELRNLLSALWQSAAGSTTADHTLITNLRHVQSLNSALTPLQRARKGLDSTLPTDLVSQDIREALYHIGSITGEISTDEVLGEIFGKFCIGK